MSEAAAPVAFHTGVVDPVGHAIRLLRKALSMRSRVVVVGQAAVLDELDQRLWTADPGSFMPHAWWSAETRDRPAVRHAPVWLWREAPELQGASPVPAPAEVLINLGIEVLAAARQFSKVIEVVPSDPAARAQGQQRWRTWREWGLNPAHHAFS